jgi:hypothetical protein
MPSLAFLTFRGKGSGGGSTSTTTLDPKIRDEIVMPTYKSTLDAMGATPVLDADGNVESYGFKDYEAYGGERLTTPNSFYDWLTNADSLDNTLNFGTEYKPELEGLGYETLRQNAANAAKYGGPSNVDWNFLGATDRVTGPTADYQTMGAANVVDPSDAVYTAASSPDVVAARDVTNQQINAAHINRNNIRDVSNAGVTGAAVAADAFGSLQPQARGSVRDVYGSGFMGGNLDQYMNPYRSQVIDTTMEALDRQRQIQQQQNAASATQAGAFGGSRQGVLEAETNRGFADQAAQTMAALNAQGFDTAASLQQADADRALQAQLANQGMDQAATQQALNLSGQFGLANQDAALRAALANQGVDASTLQFNASNTQQANMQNAANALAAAQANQQADLSKNLLGAQLGSAAALQNANMGFTANATNQASEMQRRLANQAAQMEQYKSNQGAYNQAALANQEANLQAMLANQSTALARGQSNQDAALEASLANAQYGLQGQQLAMSGNQQFADVLGIGRDMQFQNLDTRLAAGDMVDTREQDELDLQYANWLEEQNYGINQANLLTNAMSGVPQGSQTITK